MSTYHTDRDKARIAYLLGRISAIGATLALLGEAEIESATLTGQLGEKLSQGSDELRTLLFGDDTARD